MSPVLGVLTSPYDRKARLQPALLSVLPLLLLAVIASLPDRSYMLAAAGVMIYCGVAMLLTQIGRDRGKRLEPALFSDWGGKPSVAMLRHRDTRISDPTKERYREFLDRNVPNLRLPTAAEENENPGAADARYQAATDWLISQTRDQNTYELLFRENMSYGFRRNLWALRPVAITIDLLILGTVILAYGVDLGSGSTALDLPGWISEVIILVTGIHLAVFCLVTTQRWVRVVAESYAERLLESCDRLQGTPK